MKQFDDACSSFRDDSIRLRDYFHRRAVTSDGSLWSVAGPIGTIVRRIGLVLWCNEFLRLSPHIEPEEVSPQSTVAIVMSRLPRLIVPEAIWLRGMRAALRRVSTAGATLLIGDGTAGSDVLRRGAERLGLPHRMVSCGDTNPVHDELGLPTADRSLLDAADVVLVLGLRARGNLHRLLLERLAQQRVVELVDRPQLQPDSVRADLLSNGALLWSPNSNDEEPLASASETEGDCLGFSVEPKGVCEIVPFPGRNDWTFLSHTTRSCPSPWPGQSSEDYLDSLLEGRPDADHSAVAALSRIVTERRLIAAGKSIRGKYNVVSFTAVPLLDLPDLHRFRSHRGRWDFEPFGICVRKDWLERRGARLVVYGDESTWLGMNEPDCPYFQLARSGASRDETADREIDWTVEREWRHEGDLDLSSLAADEALVFVPNYESARRLSALSPWPVTLWPDPSIEIASESISGQ